MIKKICFILSLSAIICTTAFAANDTTQKKEVLQGLGVYSENPVTCGGFIEALSGFLYDNPDMVGSVEDIARNTGMIEKDESYNSNTSITVEQAYKYAIVTLGYKVVAESTGYMQVASKLGLTDGVGTKGILREDDAVEILYNMLDTEPMLKFYKSERDNGYVVGDGETLLSVNRNIYRVKGVMTSTDMTSIYGDAYIAAMDRIMIDENEYISKTDEFDDLLGKNVIAFVKEDATGDHELVYMYENSKNNTSLNIDCKEIKEIGDSISSFTYYEKSGKQKTVKVTPSPRVIYNGKFIEEYNENDFLNGYLELIDNDNDRKYDIIKVTAYQTVIVESVDKRDMIIKNRYKFADCLSELDLDDFDVDMKYNFYNASGDKISYSEVKVDDVLSVAASKDGTLINVYVSDAAPVTGTVEKIDEDDECLTIFGIEYAMSADFKKYIAESGKIIESGKSYTFLVNYFGEISYIKDIKKNNYSMLLEVYVDTGMRTCYGMFMDMKGDWFTYPIRDKVKIDGKIYNSAKTAVNEIKNDGPQIVILKCNSKNEITEIDRAANYAGKYTDEFCKTADMRYTYRSGDRFFQTGTDVIYLEDNAKVIIFPTENIYDTANWQVSSASGFFEGDVDYTISCYNPDKFRFTDLISISNSSQLTQARTSKSLYIITGFEERLVDDEVLPVIKGNVGQFRNLSFIGKERGMFDSLEKGDVVNLALDSNGKVEYVTKVFSLMNFAPYTGGIYTSSSYHAGAIEEIDIEKGRMFVNCGASIPFKVSANKTITIFDISEKTCENKTAETLHTGDKIVIRTSWGKIEEIICIRK